MCLVNTSTIKFIFHFLYHAPENRNLNNFLGHQAIETVFGTQVFFCFIQSVTIFLHRIYYLSQIFSQNSRCLRCLVSEIDFCVSVLQNLKKVSKNSGVKSGKMRENGKRKAVGSDFVGRGSGIQKREWEESGSFSSGPFPFPTLVITCFTSLHYR